ncbi:MAG: 6-phosphogluconolactonase [Sphingomonadales bacterium]|nr:6-phosphogluconolactonase [Sphingomonadales bacterium]
MIRPVSLMCGRRAVIAGGLALVASRSLARLPGAEGLVAGTYEHEGGKGLYPISRSGGGDWTVGPPIPLIDNVSFGAWSPRFGLLYLLNESDHGGLLVYDRNYRLRAAVPTRGWGPCHTALSPDQSAIAVANYSSGSVALWRLDKTTGLPQAEAQLAQHEGRGPNSARQAGPHAHWVGFSRNARWLHSVDLGADAIFAHAYSADMQKLGDMRIAYRAQPGSGPRHLARHPRLPIAYLVAELANTLTVLREYEDGNFRDIAVTSTLPAGFGGASAAAHIALNADGTRLYISNRGHNSIAVFAIELNGAARLIQHIDSGGDWPRFFLLTNDHREILVANERSGMIACFSLDRDGRLKADPRIVPVPGVVFLGSLHTLD